MTVIYESGFDSAVDTYDIACPKILHSGLWQAAPTLSATTTATGYNVNNLINPLTYNKWRGSSTALHYITLDLGSSQDITCLAVAGHNFAEVAAAVNVQVDTGGVGSWANVTPATVVTDDSPIMFFFESVSTADIRLKIASGSVAPEIAVLFCGEYLQLPRPLFGGHAPTDFTRKVSFLNNMSESGEILGRTVQRKERPFSMALRHLPYSWMETNWFTLQDALEENPCWIAWRPDTTYEGVVYGMATEVPNPTFMGIRDLMEVSIAISGYGW